MNVMYKNYGGFTMSFLTDRNTRLVREMATESFIQRNFLISEEAYFGKDNDFVTDLIAAIDDLRMGYEKAYDSKRHGDKINSMLPLVKRIEQIIASNINVDRVSINLMPKEVNAYCLPMCWDSSLMTGRRKAVELEDIVETKKGYRFKSSEGKTMIFGLGLGLFDKNFPSDEIAAILLHEVGHGMQHMLHGVNNNLQYHSVKVLGALISNLISTLNVHVDPSFFYNILDRFIVDEDKKVDKTRFLEKIMLFLGTYGNSRTNMADSQDAEREKTIKRIKEDNIFMKFFKLFFKSIGWIISAVISIMVYPFMVVISTIGSIIVVNHGITEFDSDGSGFLIRNKKWEQFADHFAAVYGLGPQLANGLKGLDNAFYRKDVKSGAKILETLLLATPFTRLGYAAADYQRNTSGALRVGYDNTKGRITNTYKTLKYELENNKDLTAKEKNDITKQLNEIQSSFEELFSDKNEKPHYAILKDYINTNIDTIETGVENNVLKVLTRNKENFKNMIKAGADINAAPKRSVSENIQGIMKMSKIIASKNKDIAAIQPKLAAKMGAGFNIN